MIRTTPKRIPQPKMPKPPTTVSSPTPMGGSIGVGNPVKPTAPTPPAGFDSTVTRRERRENKMNSRAKRKARTGALVAKIATDIRAIAKRR